MDDGADLFDPDSIANGYVKEINKMRNHQLGLLRSLGLTFTAIQSQTAARRTAAENEAREAVETAKKPDSGMGLLAVN